MAKLTLTLSDEEAEGTTVLADDLTFAQLKVKSTDADGNSQSADYTLHVDAGDTVEVKVAKGAAK